MIKGGKAGPADRKREKQTRYLSQAIQLEESVNPHIIRATMTMVSMAVLVFLGLAAVTNINEVARAPGEVVPYGYQQTVQHLEGGIVGTIHIHEGEVVNKGDVLVSLSDKGVKDDLERVDSKQLSLMMQAERLRAFIDDRNPDFSKFPGATPDMIADQLSFFEGMRTARQKEAQIIQSQIKQKKQSLDLIEADISTADRNYTVINDIYQRRLKLNKNGYASDMQMLEDRKRLNDAEGEIKRLENQSIVATAEIYEFESRLQSLGARNRDEAQEKLDSAQAEIEQNEKLISKLKERIGRLDVRAPVRGIVKGLEINTIGAIIQPGQTIMEIVPLDEKLEVQVKISPKDIGHLSIGQPVQIKFSAYDFSRYGSVRGRLDRISATTFTGDNGDRYYQGQVALDKNYVGQNKEDMILPGMTVMADVITGDKTILQYLLKPINNSLRTAFTER